ITTPLVAASRVAPGPARLPARSRRKLDTRWAGSPPRAARTAAADAMWGVPGAHSGGWDVRLPKGGRKLMCVPTNRPEATTFQSPECSHASYLQQVAYTAKSCTQGWLRPAGRWNSEFGSHRGIAGAFATASATRSAT